MKKLEEYTQMEIAIAIPGYLLRNSNEELWKIASLEQIEKYWNKNYITLENILSKKGEILVIDSKEKSGYWKIASYSNSKQFHESLRLNDRNTAEEALDIFYNQPTITIQEFNRLDNIDIE